jgi:hypothetical protein
MTNAKELIDKVESLLDDEGEFIDYECISQLVATAKQLQNRCAELQAERDEYKETARQYTNLASKGVYYMVDELAAHDAEVARKAYRQGFMDSGEGFNGELYQDGFSKVVSGYNQMEAEYIENIKEQAK